MKIIVADNYDEHIFNNDKNVVVLYYAPWCGHCHKFDPIYRRIGKRLKLYINQNEDYKNDVIISKIDAANNEIYNVPIGMCKYVFKILFISISYKMKNIAK